MYFEVKERHTQGSNCGGEGRYARPRGGESGFSGAYCQSLRSSSQTEPECGESAGTVPTAAQEVKYIIMMFMRHYKHD